MSAGVLSPLNGNQSQGVINLDAANGVMPMMPSLAASQASND